MRRILLLLFFSASLAAQNVSMGGNATAAGNAVIDGVGTAVVLQSIAVSPSNPTVCYACSQSFSATGTYSDGSHNPITSSASWSSSNTSVATSSGNGNFQCVARGTVTVQASLSGVDGSTSLNCQSPTLAPLGTQNVTQAMSSENLVQYTGANGVSPFTFTISGQPSGWSLSNSGCSSDQVNCWLVGTPATVGVFSFFVQVTDAIGNTACPSPGCAVSVNVVAGTSEDNIYCELVTNVETVTGLSMDGPANPLANCNYTAIAWSSLSVPSGTGTGTIVNVCQYYSTLATVCASLPDPSTPASATVYCNPSGSTAVAWGVSGCTMLANGPFYSNTMQGAFNFVAGSIGGVATGLGNLCGAWIQVAPTISLLGATSQAVYTEPTVTVPTSLNCGPDYTEPWVWVSTSAYNSSTNVISGGLAPGQRISPAWAGQSSIIGRPAYAQPSGGAALYIPAWRCENPSGTSCTAIQSQAGGVLNGVRFIGIEFTAPHGRDSSTDLYGTHVCGPNLAGTPQCDPGFVGGIANVGCTVVGHVTCTNSPTLTGTVNTQNASSGSCPQFCVSLVSGTPFTYLGGSQFGGTVNTTNSSVGDCTSNCVSLATGTNFVNFQDGQTLSIAGVLYTICTMSACGVSGSISGTLLQLTAAPGTQSGATYLWNSANQILINGATFGVANVYSSSLIGVTTAPGTQSGVSYAWNTGSQHVIFDRVLFAACDDLSFLTCYGTAQSATLMQQGQHLSIIDSYLVGFTCLYGIGACVDSHAISGGLNEQTSDLGIKIVDDYIESAGEITFFGGGTSNGQPMDIEVRRNHFYKPLTWKLDNPLYQNNFSGIGDAWVSKQNSAANPYVGTVTCAATAPAQSGGTAATCSVSVNGSGQITDVLILTPGAGYGLCFKGNSNTYACSPSFLFTDSTGTYTTCNTQIAGDFSLSAPVAGVYTATWIDGNKFVNKLVGTNITVTIGSTNYTFAVTGETNGGKTATMTDASGPSGASPLASWVSTFNARGDCAYAMIGYYDIKNLSEMKNGIRSLWEGNIAENSWVGQSDQDGFCFVISPKNQSGACPNCAVTDLTYRYNFCRNTDAGIIIGDAPATQGGELASYLNNLSFHDYILDAMVGPYMTTGTSPIYSEGGTALEYTNASAPAYAAQNATFNHFTAIFTTPAGFNYSGTTALENNFNLQYTKNGTAPALLQNFTMENFIAVGGIKNLTSHGNGTVPALFGGPNCSNNACKNVNDPSNPGPTEIALRQGFPSDYLALPSPSGGNYSGNILTALQLTAQGTGGTCTTAPTSCSVAAPSCSPSSTHSCHAAICGLNTSGNAVTKLWLSDPGAGYSSAPAVSFSGGNCSSPPTATAWIAGSGQPDTGSACFDHAAMPTAQWSGEIAMTPYPAAQVDPVNNACASTTGGHINTNSSGTPITVSTWADVKFVGFNYELSGGVSDGAECNVILPSSACQNGQTPGTGDLHLSSSSPFYHAGNDGLDIGANVDDVLGQANCSSPVPSQYTGIYLCNGVAILPQ